MQEAAERHSLVKPRSLSDLKSSAGYTSMHNASISIILEALDSAHLIVQFGLFHCSLYCFHECALDM